MMGGKLKLGDGFIGNRHGLDAVKRRVRVKGLEAFDLRSAAAKRMIEWRDELLASLGGADNISAQEYALVEMLVRTRLQLEHIDAYILGLDSLLNRKKHSLKPIVRERLAMVETCARLLSQLGLQQREKRVPSLAEYLSQSDDAATSPDQATGEAQGGRPDDEDDQPPEEQIDDATDEDSAVESQSGSELDAEDIDGER
jgi:hypothetical protein